MTLLLSLVGGADKLAVYIERRENVVDEHIGSVEGVDSLVGGRCGKCRCSLGFLVLLRLRRVESARHGHAGEHDRRKAGRNCKHSLLFDDLMCARLSRSAVRVGLAGGRLL